MTALASTDITVTVQERVIKGIEREHLCKFVFGDDALTYPSGGIPIPTFPRLGFFQQVKYLDIIDPNDADGFVWKYDKENKKLRCYVQGYDHGTGGSVTLDDYPITAAAGVTTGISISLTTGAGAAVGRLGALVEMDTASAPAATTMYVRAVGY